MKKFLIPILLFLCSSCAVHTPYGVGVSYQTYPYYNPRYQYPSYPHQEFGYYDRGWRGPHRHHHRHGGWYGR